MTLNLVRIRKKNRLKHSLEGFLEKSYIFFGSEAF